MSLGRRRSVKSGACAIACDARSALLTVDLRGSMLDRREDGSSCRARAGRWLFAVARWLRPVSGSWCASSPLWHGVPKAVGGAWRAKVSPG